MLGWSCLSTVILPPSNMVIVTKDRNFHKVPHMELQLYLGVKIFALNSIKENKNIVFSKTGDGNVSNSI